jgi:hypothetical protein
MGASFGAGAILLTIGYAAVSLARTKQQHLLCVIPLIFSLQQFIEGMLWFVLQRPAYAHWQQLLLYLFLLLAQVTWPLIVPLCTWQAEREPIRRKVLSVFTVAGAITSGIFLYGLFFYDTSASIGHHHIKYTLDFPLLHHWYGGIPYLVAAVGPPLVSSNPRMRLIGVLLLLSYFVTYFFYKDYLISVWCYFAAIISVVVLYDIAQENRLHVGAKFSGGF